MPTVQFDNGTKVQFDTDPSEADINEVAQKMGIGGQNSTPATTDSGTGSALAKIATSVFPNKNIGEVIGSGLAPLFTPKDARPFLDTTPHTTIKGVAGDVGGDLLNLFALLSAPETGGASMAARSAVNAGIGGGLNLSNSLSQGKGVTDPGVLKSAGESALISSLFPSLAKPFEALSNSAKAASGVTPQIETILKNTAPSELQDYIQATLKHNSDLNTPTAVGLASSKLSNAAETISSKLKSAGQDVGNAIKTTGAMSIGDNPATKTPFTDEILSSFNKKLEDTFGHEVSYMPPDNTSLKIGGDTMRFNENQDPSLLPLEGRSRTIAPADQKRILSLHDQILNLANSPTVAKASDVVRNLDDLIDYSKVDKFGVNHDPLQGIIRSTRGEINGAIRATSPDVAVANDRFSQLKGIEQGIGQMAGKNLQRGELLLQRVFSGDKSGQSLKLLNDIKNETGVDLIKHAGLARFATENFGDASSKTLLQQALNTEGSLAGGMKRALLSPIKNVSRKLLVPDTEKYAMNLTKGANYSGKFDELLNSNAGRGLLRTYLNNVSAAHPQIGAGLGRTMQSLMTNLF